jgi:hypothetical protein
MREMLSKAKASLSLVRLAALLLAATLIILSPAVWATANGSLRSSAIDCAKSDKNGNQKQGNQKKGGKKNKESKHHRSRSRKGRMPEGIYVRIIPFSHAMKPGWDLRGHNGQDVLNMIEQLKPDVLNRFTTGRPKLSLKVPMGDGQTMKFPEYLTAAMYAGAPGCYLTPKVHLNHIWSDEYRLKAAKELRAMPVTPQLHALDLDCYFSKGGNAEHRQELRKFKEMGWSQLGFNYAGKVKKTFGMGGYGMAAVSRHTWRVNTAALQAMKRQGIKTLLVHIDYARAIAEFKRLAPDRQADIILKRIAPMQKRLGFRFIYPIAYSGYDSTKEITKKHGKYKGASLFELMKRQIDKDRQQLGGKQSHSNHAKHQHARRK